VSTGLRIILADDHEIIRGGLRSLLQVRRDWEICGEAANGREAVELAQRLRPDIAIMDLTMPVMNGLEATRQIRKLLPQCEVLMLTMHHSESLMREVLDAGARGYVLKSNAGSMVVNAVEALRHHKPFVCPEVSDLLMKAYLDTDTSRKAPERDVLTSRERELVQLIAEGKSSKEAADMLHISEKTAETHRANLMRKLGIHSVSEIVRYAIRNNMIQP
jgi:DNA-binding NarL/FixJ family response regulator